MFKRINALSHAMEVRGLEAGDAPAVRDIARRSLESSYADVLSSDVIPKALDAWYDDEAF